jgi:hypothetical protein
MPLTLIKEDGTGLSDANTYASEADADAFFERHLYADYWVATVNLSRRVPALAMATRSLTRNGSSTARGRWPARRSNGRGHGLPGPGRGGGGAKVAEDAVPSVSLTRRANWR